jgi:hypothetical protein
MSTDFNVCSVPLRVSLDNYDQLRQPKVVRFSVRELTECKTMVELIEGKQRGFGSRIIKND